jgi:RNA polymerase sigma factor (sigma-70 family)
MPPAAEPPAPPQGRDRLALLAERVAAGGPAGHSAEADLLADLGPRVHRFAACRLSGAEAADFAQQALLVVVEALRAGRLERPEAILSFAFATCRTLAGERRRTADRRAALSTSIPTHDGSSSTDEDERLADLAACLQLLDARPKQVVYDSFYLGRTADEIAQSLTTSTGNVRVLRHRALESLRRCVERRTREGAER